MNFVSTCFRQVIFRPLTRLLLCGCLAGNVTESHADRVTAPDDLGWKFQRGDFPQVIQPATDVSGWREVTLPHDWSIEGPFAATNHTGGAGAFLPSGVAWYVQDFNTPLEWMGRRVFIQFDGVMQNSDVWINGIHLGHRPNGYVSFEYELTAALKSRETNRIAVRVDTSKQPASRWYSGAGIYRHVRFLVMNPLHFVTDGVFVSTPVANVSLATVRIQACLTNQDEKSRSVVVQGTLCGPDGHVVASRKTSLMLPAGAGAQCQLELPVIKPSLWSPDSPVLYTATTRILERTGEVDEITVPVGIRDIQFSAAQGLLVNGKKLMVKGVCLHHEGGAFGAAVPLAIWQQRLSALRLLGVNAIRTAHNPPDPGFLDLCDRMGFLVMDEFFDCWTVAKNPYDYHLFFREWSARDTADCVQRDRNHPCVILYSIGNEIHDTRQPSVAIPIARQLVAICHANDPTRSVTQALFRPNATGDYTNGLAELLDVIGTNYRDPELLAAQREGTSRKIINTEQKHDVKSWLELRNHPSLAGQFLWTGVDYLGETHAWPLVGHASGLLDRTGIIKPMAFERQSWWSQSPVVHIVRRIAADDRMPKDPGYGGPELYTQVQFADWTPLRQDGHLEKVEVYSNCREVELFLNGQSLGSKPLPSNASPREWLVSFMPGVLKAIARDHGKETATDELRTAGKPSAILLQPCSLSLGCSWEDVAIVRAVVVDASGIEVPGADNRISFQVTGPAQIVATDNGDNSNPGPFQSTVRNSPNGLCTVYVKADPNARPGDSTPVTLTASAPGLVPGQCSFPLVKSDL